jgi:hypothetical protein
VNPLSLANNVEYLEERPGIAMMISKNPQSVGIRASHPTLNDTIVKMLREA